MFPGETAEQNGDMSAVFRSEGWLIGTPELMEYIEATHR
jgi:hypothetical protein